MEYLHSRHAVTWTEVADSVNDDGDDAAAEAMHGSMLQLETAQESVDETRTGNSQRSTEAVRGARVV